MLEIDWIYRIEGAQMSVEWDWMLRQGVEQAKVEGVDRDEVGAYFEEVLAEEYGRSEEG